MPVLRKELHRASWTALAVAILGWHGGSLLPWALAATVLSWGRQIYWLGRLEKCLAKGTKGDCPEADGGWADVYHQVCRLKKNGQRRKKKLRRFMEQIRLATEALPDAAVVLRLDDGIEWANKAARQVLGLQPDDRGQRITNLIRFPEFTGYLKSRQYHRPTVIPSPINHRLTLEVRIIPYGDDLRLMLAQDVTQLKKMETMRKDFVANVSHELRTPLTVLKGYLETLQDMDDGSSALLTASFKEMQGQTERMQHLVDDLLLLTRLETQQKKPQCIDVPALLNQICKEGDTLGNAGRRIELTLETTAHIYGEEQDLRSAFTNLLGNALKYSPADTPVKVRWFQAKQAIVLEVEDFGEGIAPVDIPRVTERFYRVESKRRKKVPGTGLGLAIVKHVLMRHDAHLGIVSELGKGSCFSCQFPLGRVCCK